MSIQAISNFENGIKEGDVIDLMNFYDSDNTRYIDLNFVKERLDNHIQNIQCKIKLVSIVKDICEEDIIDKDEEDGDNTGRGIIRKRKVEFPQELFDVALDFYSGAIERLPSSDEADPSRLFNKFSRAGLITQEQLKLALYNARVHCTDKQIYPIFKYFFEKQQLKDGNVSRFGDEDVVDAEEASILFSQAIPNNNNLRSLEDYIREKIVV
jgi:hypothetical protein